MNPDSKGKSLLLTFFLFCYLKKIASKQNIPPTSNPSTELVYGGICLPMMCYLERNYTLQQIYRCNVFALYAFKVNLYSQVHGLNWTINWRTPTNCRERKSFLQYFYRRISLNLLYSKLFLQDKFIASVSGLFYF